MQLARQNCKFAGTMNWRCKKTDLNLPLVSDLDL